VFAQAFIQYFVVLTDYGFNLSATRTIASHHDENKIINETFNAIIMIKLSLALLSLVFLVLILSFAHTLAKDWLLYMLTFGTVVGNVFFPLWLFLGMEKMQYVVILNVASRLIFLLSIFIFIRDASDYLYVPLINSLGSLTSGLLSM
jgi:PST family polysaccharide transporter